MELEPGPAGRATLNGYALFFAFAAFFAEVFARLARRGHCLVFLPDARAQRIHEVDDVKLPRHGRCFRAPDVDAAVWALSVVPRCGLYVVMAAVNALRY